MNYKKYKSYLEGKTGCYPFMRDVVDLYTRLIDIWDSVSPDDLSPLFDLPASGRIEKIPLITMKRLKEIDFSGSVETGERVLELFRKEKKGRMIGYPEEKELSEFIIEGLAREDRYRIPLLKWMLKPSLDYTISSLDIDTAGWDKGKCPLCFAPPGLAIGEKELLSCCFCRYRWSYNLSVCTVCGNSRREKRGFFAGDSSCDRGERAVSCECCKTYIKTIFPTLRGITSIEELDMDIEDVATLYLDLIANDRGFRGVCQ